MYDCNKRQREVNKGVTQLRCVNPPAEAYKQIVSLDQCHACPMRSFIKPKAGCGEIKEPRLELFPILHQENGFPACPHRVPGEGGYVCQITNLPVDKDICGRCDADVREHVATFGEKVTNYFSALRKWAANGCPTRTPEERAELFNNHCNGCERFDREAHACKNCGCKVSADGSPLENKLAMATEHCPLGRF